MTVKIGYSISDISAIKLLPTSLLTNGYARLCRSVNAWFSYNSTSTATADDISILLPASGTGRWFKIKADVTATDVLNFDEAVDDRVAALVQNSSTVSASYNDAANTLTFSVVNGSIGDTQVSSLSQSKITNLTTDLAAKLSANQNITVSGDATGSGATNITLTLANSGVTAGSYTSANITVDSKGRISSASNGIAPPTYITVTSDLIGVSNKIYSNKKTGSQLQLSLPTTSNVNDEFGFVSSSSYGVRITQGSLQYIQNESTITDIGLGNGIESTNIGTAVRLVCTEANKGWLVTSKLGTITNFSSPLDSDALAYITAIETTDGLPLESLVKSAINEFVLGCKYDGIWSAIQSCCILSGARTLSGALIPLKGTAPTNYNFVSGDYNRKTGLKGNAINKYLDSNRADNADALNDCHVSIFSSEASSGSGFRTYLGAIKDVFAYSTRTIFVNDPTSQVAVLMRYGENSVLGANTAGFIGGTRDNSSTFKARIGGTTTTRTQSSDTASSLNISVYAANYGGSIIRYSDARLNFYSIGSNLDLALLEARVSTLISQIGTL